MKKCGKMMGIPWETGKAWDHIIKYYKYRTTPCEKF
jgi:hypothetical protein